MLAGVMQDMLEVGMVEEQANSPRAQVASVLITVLRRLKAAQSHSRRMVSFSCGRVMTLSSRSLS